MSQQQEMNDRYGPQSSYSGYEGTFPTHDDTPHFTAGQKLSQHQGASAGQRLALAIVSLSMFVFMTFGLVLIAVLGNANIWAAFPIVFILTLFAVAAIIINVVFNRSR
jgi:hypothetical protein